MSGNVRVMRICPLRVWMGVEKAHWSSTRSDVAVRLGGRTVAKIIEFYIPSTFSKSGKWVPPKERGKVIEFVPETKKTA
jgi:hypothetical protein